MSYTHNIVLILKSIKFLSTLSRKIRYVKHLFVTLTYQRSNEVSAVWTGASKDYNKYIQKLRRFHGSKIQYLRAVEAHQDGYPHFHAILQFHDVLSVYDDRYIDGTFRARLKELWSFGFSDYSVPRSGQIPIFYLVKYISKSTHTHRTLWKKLFAHSVPDSTKTGVTQSASNVKSDNAVEQTSGITNDSIKFFYTLLFCKQYKIKQVFWSRNFIFPTLPSARRPETISLLSPSDKET